MGPLRYILLLVAFIAINTPAVAEDRDEEAKRERARRRAEERALDVDPVEWTSRPGHPRLMADEKAWKAARSKDPIRRAWLEKLRERGDAYIVEGREIEYEKVLLPRSREAMQRLPTLAGLWRVTGEKKYADAGRRELLNLCSVPDWSDGFNLSTAEMATAVAVGYDWLHDTLSKKERDRVVAAIVKKALQPSIEAYGSAGGWTTATHNWNLVCNGGLIVASLAVLEEEPETASRVLGLAMKSIRNGLGTIDRCRGGWAEGPMYHNYALRYAVFAAAALESAPEEPVTLRSKFLKDAGRFRIQLEGPTGKSFNFGDSDEVIGNSAWLMWLGSRFDNRYTLFQASDANTEPNIFDLLWYVPTDAKSGLPAVEHFPVCEVVTLRNSFKRDASYVALKGGSTVASHTHLDVGTFVLDMLGERWASELGADNYELPGYHGPRRADYLRSSTPGQNTLTINNQSQPDEKFAEVKDADEDRRAATIDLTDAYPAARRVTRTAWLTKNDGVAIRDEIRLNKPADVAWHLHTTADVQLLGDTIVLQQNGKRVHLRVAEPADARVEIFPDRTEPPALPIKGMMHVRISVEARADAVFSVEFKPISDR